MCFLEYNIITYNVLNVFDMKVDLMSDTWICRDIEVESNKWLCIEIVFYLNVFTT